MSTVGTLSTYDDATFPGCRFLIPSASLPPPHALRCLAHGWYRAAHCPRCLIAFEEAALVGEIRRVARKVQREGRVRRCRRCKETVPFGRRVYCSEVCYRAANADPQHERERR